MTQYQDSELDRHAAEHLGQARIWLGICVAMTTMTADDGDVTATLPAPFQPIMHSRLVPGPVQDVQHSEHRRLDPRGL